MIGSSKRRISIDFINKLERLKPLAATQRPFGPKGDFPGQADKWTDGQRVKIKFLNKLPLEQSGNSHIGRQGK